MKTALPASLSSAEDIREAIDELRLGIKGSSATDAKAARETIETYERAIADAPRVGVTLATPADAHSKAVLTEWFRANLAPDVIVSFGHNRSLLGGVLVRAGSRIYDWSYRSRLLESDITFTGILDYVR